MEELLIRRQYREDEGNEETNNNDNKQLEIIEEEPVNLMEVSSFEFRGGGGYRNVLERYYVSYTGPHQEAVYQHSNG